MSALAHMIETRGIATVVIGLVRLHMEKTRPPRGLWVPFPLGRPLGEPENPSFQRRVLIAALGLLEREDGPVILEDFPDDAPSMRDRPDWAPQFVLPSATLPSTTDAAGWVRGIEAEMAKAMPHWEAARRRFGKTMVGNSRLPPEAWVKFAARFLGGELPDSPVGGLSPGLVVRYIADDAKALYMEAVQAVGLQPSIAQVNRWFWNKTLAGEFLRALRSTAIASPHAGFNTVGSRFLVPAPFVVRT